MQRTTHKFHFGGLSLIAVAAIFLATFLPADNANAGSALTGTITLDVQFVCHDGGNRGHSPQIHLTKHAGDRVDSNPPGTVWSSKPKAYYDATECYDLSTGFKRGDIIYAWFDAHGGTFQCPHFRLKYVPNRTDIWVQNGGISIFNVSCVAKWSLKGHINSPVVRPPTKTYQASEICHDGANRGAEIRLQVSDGNNRWVPAGMTYKGYYTRTQCFKLPNLKNGTKVTVYYQERGSEHYQGKDTGHVVWCDKFQVKINRKAKPMWVQTTGHAIWDIGCRARRNL